MWPMTSRGPERSRLRSRYTRGSISQKQFKTAGQYQWSTYRKSHSASRMVTSPKMLRDLDRSIHLSLNVSKSITDRVLFQWNIYRKSHIGKHVVTWPMTSCGPERSRSRPIYISGLISQKQFKIVGRCQQDTYKNSHSASRIVTSPMTSHDHSFPYIRFPIGAPLKPTLYLQRISRYWRSDVLGSWLDLSRSRDVIDDVTIRLPLRDFL